MFLTCQVWFLVSLQLDGVEGRGGGGSFYYRPDITVMVHCALTTNYLSFFYKYMGKQKLAYGPKLPPPPLIQKGI